MVIFCPEIVKREKWITEPPDVELNEAEQRFPAQRANTQMERTQSPHVHKDIQRDSNTERTSEHVLENMCEIKQANITPYHITKINSKHT